jgi:hypothetical protein
MPVANVSGRRHGCRCGDGLRRGGQAEQAADHPACDYGGKSEPTMKPVPAATSDCTALRGA